MMHGIGTHEDIKKMDDQSTGSRGSLYPDLKDKMGSVDFQDAIEDVSRDKDARKTRRPRRESRGLIGLQIDPAQMETFNVDDCCIGLYLDDDDDGGNGGNRLSDVDGNGSFVSLDNSQGGVDMLWNNLNSSYGDEAGGQCIYGEVDLNDRGDGSMCLKPMATSKSSRANAFDRHSQCDTDARSVSSRSVKTAKSVHTNPGVLLNNKPQRSKKKAPNQTSAVERLTKFGATMTRVRSSGSVHSLGALRTTHVTDDLESPGVATSGTRSSEKKGKICEETSHTSSTKNASWTKSNKGNDVGNHLTSRCKEILLPKSKTHSQPKPCQGRRQLETNDCNPLSATPTIGDAEEKSKGKHVHASKTKSLAMSKPKIPQRKPQTDARNAAVAHLKNPRNPVPEANVTQQGGMLSESHKHLVVDSNNESSVGMLPSTMRFVAPLEIPNRLRVTKNSKSHSGPGGNVRHAPTRTPLEARHPPHDHTKNHTFALDPQAQWYPRPQLEANHTLWNPLVVDTSSIFGSGHTARVAKGYTSPSAAMANPQVTVDERVPAPSKPPSSTLNVSILANPGKDDIAEKGNISPELQSLCKSDQQKFQLAMKNLHTAPMTPPTTQVLVPGNQAPGMSSPTGCGWHHEQQYPRNPDLDINHRHHNFTEHVLFAPTKTTAKPKSSSGRLPLEIRSNWGKSPFVSSPTTPKNGKNKLKNGTITALPTHEPFDLLFQHSVTKKSDLPRKNHTSNTAYDLNSCKPKKSSSFGSLGALVGGLRRGKNKPKT